MLIRTLKIIVFTNVFAHIENLTDLLHALKILISNETIIIIENHYLGAVIEKNQFDTFYHEHPRTYSLGSFVAISRSMDLNLIDFEFPKRYGGNIRIFLGKRNEIFDNQKYTSIIAQEADTKNSLIKLNNFISDWRINKKNEILKIVKEFGPIPAKAFPGRAAILIKLLNLTHKEISAVYEKPGSLKIGHYVPGTRIIIKSDDQLSDAIKSSKIILNLAWHIKEEVNSYLLKIDNEIKIIDIL